MENHHQHRLQGELHNILERVCEIPWRTTKEADVTDEVREQIRTIKRRLDELENSVGQHT